MSDWERVAAFVLKTKERLLFLFTSRGTYVKATTCSVGRFAAMSYSRDGVHGVQVTIEQRRGYTHDAQSIKFFNTYTLTDALYEADNHRRK